MRKRIAGLLLAAVVALVPFIATSGSAHAAADNSRPDAATATASQQIDLAEPYWWLEGIYPTQTECLVSAAFYIANDPDMIEYTCSFSGEIGWELWLLYDD